MNSLKKKNMMSAYTGFRGWATVGAIEDQIPDDLKKALTGKQLGMIMDIINNAYHKGRASTGAEVIDNSPTNGAVWVNCIGKIIDWKEVGAEYETITEENYRVAPDAPPTKRTYSKKIKDGQLVATMQN